jgi:hypothetical protein
MMTTENDMQKDSENMEQLESKNLKQNQGTLYDDCFYVQQKKYGLWYSTDKEGNGLITSLTEDQCVSATRFYLKGRQEGFSESKTYEGKVGGKL